MGEIHVSVTLENTADRTLVRLGHEVKANVRRTTIDAIVDTAIVENVVPEEVVERLGLVRVRTRTVAYGDEPEEQRPVAAVTVEIGDRDMLTECVVGVAGSRGRIGQMVLNGLDLVADLGSRTLRPRDPDEWVAAVRRQGALRRASAAYSCAIGGFSPRILHAGAAQRGPRLQAGADRVNESGRFLAARGRGRVNVAAIIGHPRSADATRRMLPGSSPLLRGHRRAPALRATRRG